MSHEYSVRAITSYRLLVNEVEIYNWDFWTSTRVVGGANLNYDLNSILRTGSVG
jgi:hypothetical protein